jgi:flagellar hook assembly protein FlgD
LVTIEGLSSNAEVKITDANGRLVYQTRANGGKATWDGLRLDGSRPNSGVYLVFALNSDGTETAMGKFIFMH